MGQKVNPIGLRVGINKDWNSTWYADKKTFAANLKEDQDVKNFLTKKYKACSISKVTIERTEGKLVVNIFTAKPGMIIGTKGAGIENIKKEIQEIIRPVKILLVNVKEIKKRFPKANIIAVDYDPGASESNQVNRIKLMMSISKQEQEENGKAA